MEHSDFKKFTAPVHRRNIFQVLSVFANTWRCSAVYPFQPPYIFCKCRNAGLSGIRQLNDADAGTGPFTGIRGSVRYRNSPVPDSDIRCWNADGGSIGFGAAAIAQVCPMPTTVQVQGGAESLKGSHSMENERNSLKTSAPYPLRKTWLSASLSGKSISLDITLKQWSVIEASKLFFFPRKSLGIGDEQKFLWNATPTMKFVPNFQLLRSAEIQLNGKK